MTANRADAMQATFQRRTWASIRQAAAALAPDGPAAVERARKAGFRIKDITGVGAPARNVEALPYALYFGDFMGAGEVAIVTAAGIYRRPSLAALIAEYRALGGDVQAVSGGQSSGLYTQYPLKPSERATEIERLLNEAQALTLATLRAEAGQ